MTAVILSRAKRYITEKVAWEQRPVSYGRAGCMEKGQHSWLEGVANADAFR